LFLEFPLQLLPPRFLVPLLELVEQLAEERLVPLAPALCGAVILQEPSYQVGRLILPLVQQVLELGPQRVVPLVETLAEVLLVERVGKTLDMLFQEHPLRFELRYAEVLAGVPPPQVAPDVLVIVLDDAEDDVRG